MKVVSIECPACHSRPGQKCIDVGVGDETRTKSGWHFSRARAAHYQSVAEARARAATRKTIDAIFAKEKTK